MINHNVQQSIENFIFDLAIQVGIALSRITVIEGREVGCLDVLLLRIVANDYQVHALVYQSELNELLKGRRPGRLELKILEALQRLQVLVAL